MKYKHVFFIWLLADAFLALGSLAFVIYDLSTGGNSNDLGMFLLVVGLGICFSLPSLAAMLVFHFIYTKNAKSDADYKMPYIALIVGINILYLIIGQFVYNMTAEFNAFYIGTTLAGLLAFYLVNRNIMKKAAVVNEENYKGS